MNKQLLFSICLLTTTFQAKAQSEIMIDCYTNYTFSNAIYQDSSLMEYATCNSNIAFYVSIFDSVNCQMWRSDHGNYGHFNYHPIGASGSWPCTRARPENYFVYLQQDAQQLQSLDSLINHMPSGNSFFIYTFVDYLSEKVDSLYPALNQTFENFWGADAAAADSIIVLSGTAGDPLSYHFSTTIADDHIHYEQTICRPESHVGIGEQLVHSAVIANLGNRAFRITNIATPGEIKLFDMNGREINFTYSADAAALNLQVTPNAATGIYLLRIPTGNEVLTFRLDVE